MTHAFTPFAPNDIQASIPALFERMVRHSPDGLAVRARDAEFTYGALNASANRIAHALLDARGERQEPVALMLGQGAMLIASILGVLKAGKFYVPLNVRHPRPRLTQTLEDANPSIVLCGRAHRELAEAVCPPTMTALEVESLDTANTSDPDVHVAPEGFAYIYYTSGSTGVPKGVVDNHRNVLHNIMRYTNGLRISAADRLSLVQSCSFSACVSTQFSALLNGAVLCPFDYHDEGPKRLAEWMHAERITMFHSVPALFRLLVAAAGELPDVRLVRLEGDRASWSDAALFQSACRRGSQLVNGLGTTETGIVRRYFVDHDTMIETGPLPLGYPVEDMDLIVEQDGHDIGRGSVGEIAVRSDYLATGYWRRPQMTARSFRIDGDGKRTYTTGDLGRLRADGCLDYIGRKDFHVRIRGHHVDVGALERAVLAVDGVSQVVVVTRDDRDGQPRLVAYLVPGAGSSPRPSDLRRALDGTLPSAYTAAAFVIVSELPLNANGKVDIAALPPPGRRRPPLENEFAAPRTLTETIVVRLWEELLEIDGIGVSDRFLDLGGDSLFAGRVLIRLHSQFGVELTIQTMFDAPTVAELARLIDRLAN